MGDPLVRSAADEKAGSSPALLRVFGMTRGLGGLSKEVKYPILSLQRTQGQGWGIPIKIASLLELLENRILRRNLLLH
jgi:hypothetical protein